MHLFEKQICLKNYFINVMFNQSNGLEMRMILSSEIYTGFSIMNMEIMVWYGNYAGLAQREHYIHV